MIRTSRRYFLGALAALPAARIAARAKPTDIQVAFRFAVAGCDFDLTVKSYGKVSSEALAFIEENTKHRFCAPAKGTDSNCVSAFKGAVAVAQYRFHPVSRGTGPTRIRERVIMIDRDSRLNLRAPEEESVRVEADAASDIQAFGFASDDPLVDGALSTLVSPWALMRQDLYFDAQESATLILHWKHTVESISLVDVIPGFGTRVISA